MKIKDCYKVWKTTNFGSLIDDKMAGKTISEECDYALSLFFIFNCIDIYLSSNIGILFYESMEKYFGLVHVPYFITGIISFFIFSKIQGVYIEDSIQTAMGKKIISLFFLALIFGYMVWK